LYCTPLFCTAQRYLVLMASERLKLSYFPDDGRIWRVEWINDIQYNHAVPSESAFVATIAPFTPEVQQEYETGLYDEKRHFYRNSDIVRNDIKEVKIGVGQSPLIDIGSLWQNGYLINSNVGIKETFNIVVDDAHVQYHPGFHRYNFNGQEIPSLPFNQQIMDYKQGRKVNCAYVQYNDDPYHFIIPDHVLINFYLCSSTSLAHAVYDGSIINSATTEIYKPEKSFYCEEESIFSIYLRMKMFDDDAWVLSRVYKTREGLKAAKLVHDSLMVQNVNNDKYLFPKTIFPFVGPTKLQLCYKHIFCKETNSYKKLVYAIYHCTAPFPFKRIQVIRDATTADKETDIPQEEKKPFNSKNKNKNPQSSPMGSSQEPSNTTQTNKIDKPQNRFGFTEDKPIEKPLKDQCLYKSAKAQKLEDVHTNQQGTGHGTWGSSNTSKGSINTKRAVLDTSFETFIEAIEELNNHKDFTASIRKPTDETRTIPLIKPGKYRQWSYLDSSLQSKRAVIIADIEYMSKHFCLIDFKFREKESYSRAIISRKDFLQPNNDIIHRTLIRLASAKGRWVNITKIDYLLNKPVITKHSEPNIETIITKIKTKLITTIRNTN